MNEAADKISAILSSPEKQDVLRAHLAHRSEMFSAGKFMEAARTQIKKATCTPHATERTETRKRKPCEA